VCQTAVIILLGEYIVKEEPSKMLMNPFAMVAEAKGNLRILFEIRYCKGTG
jgi:hypothetical protein